MHLAGFDNRRDSSDWSYQARNDEWSALSMLNHFLSAKTRTARREEALKKDDRRVNRL